MPAGVVEGVPAEGADNGTCWQVASDGLECGVATQHGMQILCLCLSSICQLCMVGSTASSWQLMLCVSREHRATCCSCRPFKQLLLDNVFS